MTCNIKNATIVFAVAALLMATPLVSSIAYADSATSTVDPLCGFTPPGSISLGTITRGSVTAETLTTFTPTATSTASATISITATDWIGDGDRASGTLTFVDVTSAEAAAATVNTLTYSAVVGTAADDTEFSIDGSAIDDAAALAAAVNSRDTLVRASTSATNVVTILAETRGNALGLPQNSYPLTGLVGITEGASTLLGGGANAIQHMLAAVTQVKVDTTATSSTGGASGSAYDDASKIPLAATGVIKEIVTGTDPDEDMEIVFHITGAGTLNNLPYDGALTQTLTFSVVCT